MIIILSRGIIWQVIFEFSYGVGFPSRDELFEGERKKKFSLLFGWYDCLGLD